MDLVAMMDSSTGGSLMLAITIIGFAIWLQRNENECQLRQQTDSGKSDIDRAYLNARSKSRRRTNRLIGICGLLVVMTALISHPIAWMTIWLLVMLCLLVVIGMAGKDAIRTYRFHKEKLKEVRRIVS